MQGPAFRWVSDGQLGPLACFVHRDVELMDHNIPGPLLHLSDRDFSDCLMLCDGLACREYGLDNYDCYKYKDGAGGVVCLSVCHVCLCVCVS